MKNTDEKIKNHFAPRGKPIQIGRYTRGFVFGTANTAIIEMTIP